ncbi:MAG TPA: glycosyltransferase family 9 protein [Gemmatimonadaceae bacterium]|nr:glycosyltransferase family 9 protein [Gemmatimonadaceae bacterium]
MTSRIQAKLDRVCIVMMSALGDAVHTLPVITAIKRHHPAAHITWVLQPGSAQLARGHSGVDEIILFDRKRGARAFLDIRERLHKRRFDVVLALQVYLKAGIITRMTAAPVKLGFDRARARDLNWLFTTHRIPAHPVQHVQDQYFEFLHALGIQSEPVEWDIGPWRHERDWQREFFRKLEHPIASLVVATSKPDKDWPPERWARVCDALWLDHGVQPVLVGGRSERELAAGNVIVGRSSAPIISTLGMSVREMVSVIDGSVLTLSPDTGPMHMSVALGTPVISLFGYTNPKRTGPYRFCHDMIVDAYGDPGENYVASMEHRPGRMLRIQPEQVLEKLGVWRERYASEAARKVPGKA